MCLFLPYEQLRTKHHLPTNSHRRFKRYFTKISCDICFEMKRDGTEEKNKYDKNNSFVMQR